MIDVKHLVGLLGWCVAATGGALASAACTGTIVGSSGADTVRPAADPSQPRPSGNAANMPEANMPEQMAGTGVPAAGKECGSETRALGPASLRLLTRSEYDNTVRALLGDVGQPGAAFPPESPKEVFLTSDTHRATAALVGEHMKAAEGVAAAASRTMAPPCPQAPAMESCVETFLRGFLHKAFRRPPATDEIASFKNRYLEALPDGAATALELTLRAVLQSPQFLYRLELRNAGQPPTPYELASRLSYLLWQGMPDEVLFEAARASRLRTAADVEAQARRMLGDPRARSTVREFHRQWLGMNVFDYLSKDPKVYPQFRAGMPADWRDSLLVFAESVAVEGSGKLADLYTSSRVYLSAALAPLYGVKGAGEYLLPAERYGILTHPGLMALVATTNQSSPVKRGAFIRRRFLCQQPPPPPPSVMVTPPPLDPKMTTRERFAAHIAESGCAGCHRLFEPIGFALETYDGIGRFRTHEAGLSIDTSGEVFGAPDEALAGPFTGARELAGRMAASPAAAECMAASYLTYALGRSLRSEDACAVRAVTAASKGNLRELLAAIATSASFQGASVEEE